MRLSTTVYTAPPESKAFHPRAAACHINADADTNPWQVLTHTPPLANYCLGLGHSVTIS
jgi:hypothetical protein